MGWAAKTKPAECKKIHRNRVKLKNDVTHGAVVRWIDVEIDANEDAVKTRRAMEARYCEPHS
jgi:hypothetical protein